MDAEQSPPLDITISLLGTEAERWQVRVDIDPKGCSIPMCGATIGLMDASGRHLGPSVILPLPEVVESPTTLVTELRGTAGAHVATRLRFTGYRSDCSEPYVVDQWLVQKRGFPAFIRGAISEGAIDPPEGRAMTEEELRRFSASFPAISLGTGPDKAFEAFKDDIISSMDLGEGDEVTEEILKMLRES